MLIQMSVDGLGAAGYEPLPFLPPLKKKRKKTPFWTHLSLQLRVSYSPLQQNSLHQWFTSDSSLELSFEPLQS